MSAVKVTVDVRERDLMKEITKVVFVTKALPVGDIWLEMPSKPIEDTDISAAQPLALVLERKTLADLAASLLDGRWREQKSRLLTYCSETGARPAYIIEGSLQFPPTRITAAAIRKLIHRLQFRYAISVLMTDDVVDTAGLIETLVEQIQADPDAFTAPTTAKQYYEGVQVSKKANKEDPANFVRCVLMQCPGVSAAIADAVVKEAGPTLKDIMGRDEKTVAAIKITEKRKVGPAVAKRLMGLLNPQT
jgi:ERCC4-type nuclease